MTSNQVFHSILRRHPGELRFGEVKDGPTMYGSHRRIDALFIAKSWTHPKITGYEIKVSRNDFLRDEKWVDYLPMCNELYFAAPAGIISPEELPAEVGLVVSYPSGTTKKVKKAPYRGIEPPVPMLMYLLMQYADVAEWTAKIDQARSQAKGSHGTTVAKWIDGELDGRVLSAMFKTELAKRAAELKDQEDQYDNAIRLKTRVMDAVEEFFPGEVGHFLMSPQAFMRSLSNQASHKCRNCDLMDEFYEVMRKRVERISAEERKARTQG